MWTKLICKVQLCANGLAVTCLSYSSYRFWILWNNFKGIVLTINTNITINDSLTSSHCFFTKSLLLDCYFLIAASWLLFLDCDLFNNYECLSSFHEQFLKHMLVKQWWKCPEDLERQWEMDREDVFACRDIVGDTVVNHKAGVCKILSDVPQDPRKASVSQYI